MLNLSEQELLDCTPVSYGCGGGWTTNAYQYIVDSGGVHTQADYPYTPQKNACNAKVAKLTSIKTLITLDDAMQPLIV